MEVWEPLALALALASLLVLQLLLALEHFHPPPDFIQIIKPTKSHSNFEINHISVQSFIRQK